MKGQAGLSMIEVLMTLLVISTGLLGIAGLQIGALRANQSAEYATIAAQQAQDVVERMRACTSKDLALENDCWNTATPTPLPSGEVRVTDTGNNTFWVAVLWHDRELDVDDYGWEAGTDAAVACGTPKRQTRCYFIRHRV